MNVEIGDINAKGPDGTMNIQNMGTGTMNVEAGDTKIVGKGDGKNTVTKVQKGSGAMELKQGDTELIGERNMSKMVSGGTGALKVTTGDTKLEGEGNKAMILKSGEANLDY